MGTQNLSSVSNFVVCWWSLQTAWTQIRTDNSSVLIWLQPVWHSDSVPDRFFDMAILKKKISRWQQKHEILPTVVPTKSDSDEIFCLRLLKGTATLMINMFYQKELYEPWILIQVSSKSDEKCASYGHLKNAIWPTFSRHFEYLISFQKFFNCLVFSYFYYYIICVSADMQLHT